MQITDNQLYHIYNRGNNKQQLFFNRDNYLYFLNFVRKHISPNCEILAYCLMPNHFHFLIYANENSAKKIKLGNIEVTTLGNGFRIVLSSYSKGVNVQQNRQNVLFKPKTEAKSLMNGSENYAFTCFQYIHQNPYKAGLVQKIEDWEFSSFRDYAGLRKGTLCNQLFANQFVDFDKENFIPQNGMEIETVNAYGASNKKESPHYTDQMEMFVNQQLKPMTLDKVKILKEAVRVYSPK